MEASPENPAMAADDALLRRLRVRLGETDDIIEKPMVGGLGFLWRGHLLCGVMGDELLIHVDAQRAAELEGGDGAHLMVMGGRRANSWLLVPARTVGTDTRLAAWLDRAFAFVATLPPK
jgi:hypothetical protein